MRENMYTIRMQHKRIFSWIVLMLLVILFSCNVTFLFKLNKCAIILSCIMIVLIICTVFYTNGIDMMLLFLFCSDYILVPIIIQYLTGASYGLLQQGRVYLYIPEILTFAFIYNVIIAVLNLVFKFRGKESELLQVKDYKLTDVSIQINNLIGIVFTIVAFPRLGFDNSSTRFDMLLPGHAWNQLAIVALLFNLPYLKTKKSVQLTYLFVISWFLIDGERADITGLILGLLVFYLMKKAQQKTKISFKQYLLSFLFLLIFVGLLNIIVSLRQNNQSMEFSDLIRGVLITPTTADVGYLYNVSIDFFKKFGLLNGKIFISNLQSIIPLADPVGFDKIIISANYANPGGEPLFAEPIMDFGMKGIFFIPILDFLIFYFFVSRKNIFLKKEFLVILCLIPRIVWYGRGYAYTSVLFFVPFLFLVDYCTNKFSFKSK